MQSKIIIFIALVALVVGDVVKQKPTVLDKAKNKRGLIEFGYGYGLNSVPELEYYSYPPYSAALTPAVQSVVTKDVSLPVVHQSSIPIPVEKYFKVPSYATINRIHYPVEVPKTQPIALKLAQPYVVSYVKQQLSPQVSTLVASPPTPSPIVYEQYDNLNKYSSW